MNHYRQPIIVFGFVLPFLAALICVVGVSLMRGKIMRSFEDKSSHYSSFQGNRARAQAIETKVAKERPHVSNWTEILRAETASEVEYMSYSRNLHKTCWASLRPGIPSQRVGSNMSQ